MKAVVIVPTDGVATLEIDEIENPVLPEGHVRIRVRAASVNRADLLVRAGTHGTGTPTTGPRVAGLDAAGEVIDVSPGVGPAPSPGDRVMTMVPGGLAEEVVVPADMVIPLPTGWSYEDGAAAVVGLLTEHDALVTAGRLQPGETVLVHAVTSGVGTQGAQLARVLGAGSIIGTSRRPDGDQLLRRAGLDFVQHIPAHDFADDVLELTGHRGADVVLDHVGGPYLRDNVRAAALAGRIVNIGRLAGGDGVLDMEELARKRLLIEGTTFRTRTSAQKAAVVAALLRDVDLEALADALRPVVDRILPWTRALEGQDVLARGDHLGKVVLTVD